VLVVGQFSYNCGRSFAGNHCLRSLSRADPGGGEWGDRAPLNTTKVTFFTMILHNLESTIRDVRPFCRPLFCHSSVMKYASSLLQQWTRNKTLLPNIIEIALPKVTDWIRPCFVLKIFSFSDREKVLGVFDRHCWDATCCSRMNEVRDYRCSSLAVKWCSAFPLIL